MTKHEIYWSQCSERGYIKVDELDGAATVCGVNHDLECKKGCCMLSKGYWGDDSKQVGWHEERSLELTGLKSEFDNDMDESKVLEGVYDDVEGM